MKKTDLPPNVLMHSPSISDSAWIAPNATVVGDVSIESNSSVWFNSVIRGDIQSIHIGKCTNIQDGCILHVENDIGCRIGDYVTIGHGAIIHACTIESGVLIGMGAIILNGALIKKGAIIGAGAVVKENECVGEGELWVGLPAHFKRHVDSQYETNRDWAKKYVQLKNKYQSNGYQSI